MTWHGRVLLEEEAWLLSPAPFQQVARFCSQGHRVTGGLLKTWAARALPLPLCSPSLVKGSRGFQLGSSVRKERHSLSFCLWRRAVARPTPGSGLGGPTLAQQDAQRGGRRGAPRRSLGSTIAVHCCGQGPLTAQGFRGVPLGELAIRVKCGKKNKKTKTNQPTKKKKHHQPTTIRSSGNPWNCQKRGSTALTFSARTLLPFFHLCADSGSCPGLESTSPPMLTSLCK